MTSMRALRARAAAGFAACVPALLFWGLLGPGVAAMDLDELFEGAGEPQAEDAPGREEEPSREAAPAPAASRPAPKENTAASAPASPGGDAPPSDAPQESAAAPVPPPEERAEVVPPPARREIEEIVVTATKRGLRSMQDVPVAVTAFGEEQLEAMNFHDLRSLSYSMPNVQLEDIGTISGYASFSIRGQGINSSIPSVDPTVGVFVDGVYMGQSAGLVLDNFDLEGIEVLRGPQGVLFGRNVTGGAVILRTKKPGDELEASIRGAVETGLSKIFDGSVSGPLLEDLVGFKVAAYHSEDQGWFTNLFDNSKHGASEQTIVRPALRLTPLPILDMMFRFEHGRADGDGPATQNHVNWERGTFDFAVNLKGFYDSDWTQMIFEPELDVGFGDGTITSVTGWREYNLLTAADIDGTVDDGFHAQARVEQSQISQELRYAGTFGAFEVTTGGYYFQQDLLYIERRMLGPNPLTMEGARDVTGGGDGDFSTWGVFAATDYMLLPSVILNFGLRYTWEKKEAAVSTISTTRPDEGGSVPDGTLNPNFFDDETWTDVTPKVGFQWLPIDDTQVYGFWAKGFRSGGYNFRHTTDSGGNTPGPFDAESQNSFELGLKHDLPWFPVRFNAAGFYNEIDKLQRELNVPGSSGVSQTIVNAGKATIRGVEGELRLFHLPGNFSASLFGGYLDGFYRKVTADLNRDEQVTAADKRLKIPRLAPLSWGATLEQEILFGSLVGLSSRVAFAHRDLSYFTDTNLGFIDVWDGVDVNLNLFEPTGLWSLSLYGQNLLNKASLGGHTVLPDDNPPLGPLFGADGLPGGPQPSFSPLNRGRVFGIQLRFKY